MPPEEYRALADLLWWCDRHRALSGEDPELRARLRATPDDRDLAAAIVAAESTALRRDASFAELAGSLHALRGPILARLAREELEAAGELLPRLVAVAATLRARLVGARQGSERGWREHLEASRGFQWRLFSPLRTPGSGQLALQLAFLDPEVFPAAARLERDVHQRLEATPAEPARRLLVEAARGAATSVWTRPAREAAGSEVPDLPEGLADPCQIHLGTLRAQVAERGRRVEDDLFAEPGAAVVRTLSTIECLSRCQPSARCFEDRELARRFSLDIPVRARGAHGDLVRASCQAALERLRARALTRDDELLLAPLIEGCRDLAALSSLR
jgi:hypothetical protein